MPIRRNVASLVGLVVAIAALAPSAGLAARQASQARTHLAHVATGFGGAPGGRGLAVTAAVEVNVAMRHANVAAGHPTDLAAMKASVQGVLHALAPADGAQGPGLGFGVKRAAEAVAAHIEMAVRAPDASDTIRTNGPNVAAAARALAARAQAMTALAARVLAAQTAAEAAPLVAELRTLALQLDTGADANGNGRVDLDSTEPGMNQLEAGVYAILEGERLPRVLS